MPEDRMQNSKTGPRFNNATRKKKKPKESRLTKKKKKRRFQLPRGFPVGRDHHHWGRNGIGENDPRLEG